MIPKRWIATRNGALVGVLMMGLLAVLPYEAVDGRTDPRTGRIRVIFLGEVKISGFPYPDWIRSEPKFTLQTVPCDIQHFSPTDAARYIRLYLPRTFDKLVQSYDAIIFEDFTPEVLPAGSLEWFKRAVGDEGLGILLVEFVYWPQNLNRLELWVASDFSDVLPAEPIIGQASDVGHSFYRIVREAPILNIPDVEKWAMDGASHGDIVAKQGSTIHALWKGRETEAIVSREYGMGQALQISHGWDNIRADTVINYRYLPDLIFNEILFVGQVPPPGDVVVAHNIRTDLLTLLERRQSAIVLLEFIEKFGADTARIEGRLAGIQALVALGERQYVDFDYELAQQSLLMAMDAYGDFEESAIELKAKTLFWVYSIEWVTVTGVLIICLQVVWTLMVRRRLYRAVDSTRRGMV